MEQSEVVQLVTFNLGGEEFGIDILSVQEINRMTDITKIPNAPDYVEGAINLRGSTIPIVDLRRRLGFEAGATGESTRIVVVELNESVMGFIVDSVSSVLRIPTNTIEPPPSVISHMESQYIKGVGKLDERLIILLDIQRLFEGSRHGDFSMANCA
ncbi:MAG TPA: chemotaxis protein CheW [Deltaproteobacteria bacterium]|nr:chemotaxis protein CheW [Deltaproteobacteria bacterium]